LKTERYRGVASSPRHEEGEYSTYSTYSTDEKRRDAPQNLDIATEANRSVL
jgi:hypothetical protein